MKKLLFISCIATLAGCTSAGHFKEIKMEKYDSNTNYGIVNKNDGFGVQVDYSRYQFVPESDSVATACKSQVTAIAFEHAKDIGREIKPINEQTIRLSMGRNGLLGMTSCNAYAEAQWK
ncbi:hypothetical protein N5580_13050 [Pantoea piersonii]|uniref:Lipoprotein n=1 Tax=Pantoea piersonii TaxID=2364647 RepID=A0AAJ5QIW6_9GAMM|nr:hypothetical protein [Pantoea piersonii]WBG90015.1 hypothetical protein N5580_13050 [Pantoea piersonii]